MNDEPKTATTAGVTTFLEMFRVQAGVPLDRALDEVSVLLGCIRNLTDDCSVDPTAMTAVHYLSALAKGLMNDLEVTRNSVH